MKMNRVTMVAICASITVSLGTGIAYAEPDSAYGGDGVAVPAPGDVGSFQKPGETSTAQPTATVMPTETASNTPSTSAAPSSTGPSSSAANTSSASSQVLVTVYNSPVEGNSLKTWAPFTTTKNASNLQAFAKAVKGSAPATPGIIVFLKGDDEAKSEDVKTAKEALKGKKVFFAVPSGSDAEKKLKTSVEAKDADYGWGQVAGYQTGQLSAEEQEKLRKQFTDPADAEKYAKIRQGSNSSVAALTAILSFVKGEPVKPKDKGAENKGSDFSKQLDEAQKELDANAKRLGIDGGKPDSGSGGGAVQTTAPAAPTTSAAAAAPTAEATTSAPASAAQQASASCTVAIDPGHNPKSIKPTDPKTGIQMVDYSNNYEDKDVFEVSQEIKKRLETKGFKVTLVKERVDEDASYRVRVDRAVAAKAALGVSIHTNHGQGTSEVYAQVVGDHRAKAPGSSEQVKFTNQAVADNSGKAAKAVSEARSAAEKSTVKVGKVNFDGRAELASGNITNIQLIAGTENLPWIYNEFGSASGGGTVGNLSAEEKAAYVSGVSDGIEKAMPTCTKK